MKFAATIEAFVAKRSARLEDFEDELRNIVLQSLTEFEQGNSNWFANIVEGASVLWLEVFEQTSPDGNPDGSIDLFQRELRESLERTARPSTPPTPEEVERVLRWVGVYSVNQATYRASIEQGAIEKTWVTMHDPDVRSMHSAVDGQTVPIRGTFTVGGYKLLFPGEPVGPPEVWINCRCLVVTTGGSAMSAIIGKTKFAVSDPYPNEEEGDGIHVDEDEDRELTDEELDSEELVDDITEIPWHGVLTVEGVETGDKRRINAEALRFPDAKYMPAPLMYQEYTDGVPHGKAVRVGRIDEMWREGAEIRGRGAFNLAVMEANKAIDGILFGGASGVSVDLDSAEFELEWPADMEDDLERMLETRPTEVVTAAQVRGATMVGFGAFIQGYIALGPDFEDEADDDETATGDVAPGEDDAGSGSGDEEESVEFDTLEEMMAWLESDISDEFFGELEKHYSLIASAFAPGTHDGPGWITHPRATQRLRSYWVKGKGAAKIRWGAPGDFNRCRKQLAKYVNPAFLAGTCANLHKEAIKIWPSTHAARDKAKHEMAPAFSLVAAATKVVPHKWFEDPKLEVVTPIVVDEETGRIFGHMAEFGVCHIGISERCVMAPSSPSNYGYFATGIVDTDEGPVRTGRIVMGTGHAGSMAAAARATAHYDNTGYAIADVAVGEDAHGIWFAGMLREDADPVDVRKLKASGLSGDWRDVKQNGYPDELVGILTVNVGGFTSPRPQYGMNGDKQVSLIASAGMVMPHPTIAIEPGAIRASAGFDSDELLAIGRVVADELEYRTERRERITAAKDDELLSLAESRRAERILAAKSPIE